MVGVRRSFACLFLLLDFPYCSITCYVPIGEAVVVAEHNFVVIIILSEKSDEFADRD